jgi:hypothetical protein
MFSPSHFIADFRLPIADCVNQGEGTNWQLAIGNWKSSKSYQGLTVSGFKSIFTALATGRAGLVLRTLPTVPVVLDWVVDSVDLALGSSTFAGAAGTRAGAATGVCSFCPETL